jgi:alkanesulfonate monooxygenase SsuD/methylene tetrahydromethanopterin reductase-like flavin-dependent oxidoreductase (luciferase family)
VAPVPPQPVDVWIGAMAAPAIDRAARLGDGWLASPGLAPEAAARQLEHYREACAAHGRAVGTAAIRRDIYVGASAEEARATAAVVLERGYRGLPQEALVIGNPEQVAQSFRALAELGYDDVIVRNLVSDPAQAVASTRRLAEVKKLLGS